MESTRANRRHASEASALDGKGPGDREPDAGPRGRERAWYRTPVRSRDRQPHRNAAAARNASPEPELLPTDEVWLPSLHPTARRRIAAALDDRGFTLIVLGRGGDPSRIAGVRPAALILDFERLLWDGLPDELTGPIAARVPVVALDEGLEDLARLHLLLRPFHHVLVLPSRDASSVVGALEWLLDPARRPGLWHAFFEGRV